MKSTCRVVSLVMVCGLAAVPALAQANEPARTAIAAYSGHVEPDRVIVKFVEGSDVTAVNGQLVSRDGGLKTLVDPRDPAGMKQAPIAGSIAFWSRLHAISDAQLEAQRQQAQVYWGTPLPDLRLTFTAILMPGTDLESAIDQLRALAEIEYALPVVKPAPPPVPPDFSPFQGYLHPAPIGIGAIICSTWPGGTGVHVTVCDVEYSWNYAHMDLPPVIHLGPPGIDPFNDNNHGTAVLGEMGSVNNGWGTIGAVFGASFRTAAANTAAGYNVASAITTAAAGLLPGDVILIEQQTFGPNGGNYVPCEWDPPVYGAIKQAVGIGRIVVEAAGNGGENLDGPLYSTGHGGHYPFLLPNDSGAIIVGAGAAPAAFGGSTVDRSRLWFSCYGATVDLQGWGESVTTSGYGSLYSFEGVNLWFTATFNGTSSASPIVASACVALLSVYEQITGLPLSPQQVRDYLVLTGSPQQSGIFPASQHIGPRPDVLQAIDLAFGNRDCNGNFRPDAIDIAMGSSLDANLNGIPDECDCPADFDGSGFVDTDDFDAFVRAFEAGTDNADFDGSGFVDTDDFDAFVRAFEAGC
ncbi:MAG: hypothetical protein GIKADHBN_02286 [Phycisphaerales bacterium]|nr:hypothetical protein [Phycisphaerales bacterium]